MMMRKDAETIGTSSCRWAKRTHPFWSVQDQAFVPIGHLVAGSQVLTADEQTRPSPASSQDQNQAQQVYNLEVNGEHFYYVGQQQLLVRNFCEDEALSRLRLTVDDALKFIDVRLAILKLNRSGKLFVLGENQAKLSKFAKSVEELDARAIWWEAVNFCDDLDNFSSNPIQQAAAIAYKRIFVRRLREQGYTFVNLGADSSYRSLSKTSDVDYLKHELEVLDAVGAEIVNFFGF